VVALTERGLYCEAADFYIDPWEPVDRAVITHAHAGRTPAGCRVYVTTTAGAPFVRAETGDQAHLEAVEYGAAVVRDGVRISLHPAGHIPGSAQVRIERSGEVSVISGHYKTEPDPTCAAFESLRCHTLLTEATFGLPVFRWRAQAEVLGEIHAWWRAGQQAGKASVLFAHPLGKAQRVLAGVDASLGPIVAHPEVERFNRLYRGSGIALAPTPAETEEASRALIIAPPMASNAPWLRQFGRISTALASGWMRIRGTRRRRSLDRGFVLSDHADWPGLLRAIEASGAEHIYTTEGYRGPLARWLSEQGKDARPMDTRMAAEEEA
jgi:putative mRNA 3-end processing factor